MNANGQHSEQFQNIKRPKTVVWSATKVILVQFIPFGGKQFKNFISSDIHLTFSKTVHNLFQSLRMS